MKLTDVLTITEAAELYKVHVTTIRKALTKENSPFAPAEWRQSGKVYLVTRMAMDRVYGKKSSY